jgi:hypothetical protein
MNTKTLSSLAAALVVTSLAHPAIAESPATEFAGGTLTNFETSLTHATIATPLAEHPAVLVARTWNSRGIDPNTFIVRHPAGPVWLTASPTANDNATRDPAPLAVKTAIASSK